MSFNENRLVSKYAALLNDWVDQEKRAWGVWILADRKELLFRAGAETLSRDPTQPNKRISFDACGHYGHTDLLAQAVVAGSAVNEMGISRTVGSDGIHCQPGLAHPERTLGRTHQYQHSLGGCQFDTIEQRAG
jgi:hypothetical protein